MCKKTGTAEISDVWTKSGQKPQSWFFAKSLNVTDSYLQVYDINCTNESITE